MTTKTTKTPATKKTTKTAKPAAKKSRRNQKKTLGRTAVSRKARRIRRDFFNRQMELDFLIESKASAEEIAKARKRFETVELAFNMLPKLVAELEVPKRVAQLALKAESDDEDGEGDEK